MVIMVEVEVEAEVIEVLYILRLIYGILHELFLVYEEQEGIEVVLLDILDEVEVELEEVDE